jgi:endoglycosylceramidase
VKRAGVALACALACGPALTSPANVPGRTDPAAVHVSGNVFRDGSGRELLFRGYNAKINGIFDAQFSDGRAPNETFPDFDEASATKFEELGFDALRLPINWSALEPTPEHYSDAFFAKVDAVLDMAHRHHFYVILDMHQDAYSKEIGEDGAPLWAITPTPLPSQLLSGPSDDSRRTSEIVLDAGFDFFANLQASDGRALQDAFIAAVTVLARRYSLDPAVIGFEAFNEPVVFHQDQLDAFHARIADAIHVVDQDAPLLFEPISTRNQFDTAYRPTTPFAHAPGVYAVHIYTGIFSSVPGWQDDLSLLDFSVTNAIAEAAAWGTPMFITELGCDQSQPSGAEWISHELDLQDQAIASSTAWAWEPGAWGIRHYDDQNQIVYWPDTIAAVSRPYPRAVAGDIESITRPTPSELVVKYRAYDAVRNLAHEVSASSDAFAEYTFFCDGNPAQNVSLAIGRATFTCPYSPGDHTFEVDGAN